jgi:hypothetical protein
MDFIETYKEGKIKNKSFGPGSIVTCMHALRMVIVELDIQIPF